MKKVLLTLTVVLLAVAAQAQTQASFKVHEYGFVSFRNSSTTPWSWGTLAYANDSLQKHWVVVNLDNENPGTHTFFVTGNGYVYKRGNWSTRIGDISERISEAGAVLDQITGVWYVPSTGNNKGTLISEKERRPGVNPQELKEVLPEAVTTDDNDLLYVDYEALTVFLIEAVKEQRQEIMELRSILEENGLMRK